MNKKNGTIVKSLNDLLEDIQNVLKTHEHFMLGYLYQAFAYMIQNEQQDIQKKQQ